MADLPAPPIPAFIDMTGNDWFPLHHQRLSDSAWWQTASHLARSCHIDLLLKAYRQVPAGSLPDDERELAVACGMQRDLQAFREVRAELLETWVLCADGRWYQPELAAICLETWEKAQDRRKRDRERKAAKRAEIAETLSARTPPGRRAENATEEKTGQERTEDLFVPAQPEPAKGWKTDAAFGSAWEACTRPMRQRSKSRERTWPIWRKAAQAAGGEDRLLAALKAYLKGHKDLDRTGGPGLHKWLADGTWDHWLPAEPTGPSAPPDPNARWRRLLREYRSNGYWPADQGPRPGKPGCRCPEAVLAEAGITTSPTATQKELSP